MATIYVAQKIFFYFFIKNRFFLSRDDVLDQETGKNQKQLLFSFSKTWRIHNPDLTI